MDDVQYREIRVKQVLNRVRPARFGFSWSINPYRGCQHACVYCYARKTHAFLDLDPGEGFNRQILVKINAPQRLRHQLAGAAWQGGRVAFGTATDPYQPAEGRYRLTRQLLEILASHRVPTSVTTKSRLVVRDLDLLKGMTQSGLHVNVSLATVDRRVAEVLEPGAPAPDQRLEVVRQLTAAGITAGIFMAPVVPGLTDSDEALRQTVAAAMEARAAYLVPVPLRLEASVRPWFEQQLARRSRRLVAAYETFYRGAHAPSSYRRRLLDRVTDLCTEVGMPMSPGSEEPQGRAVEERQPRQLHLLEG